MAVAAYRIPSLQVVNSGGSPIEGPYPLAVSQGVPGNLGITLAGIDAWEEEEVIGPFKNLQWSQVSYPIGYRYHAVLHFTAVESDPSSSVYGITLLHRLWRIALENQLTYAALQFRMFAASSFRPVVAGGTEWHPTLTQGKQGVYDVDFPITTRDLIATPGEWAQSQW